MSRRGASIVLSVLILMSLAACIRLLPDQWSPLPYNIDGLSELRVTQDILGSHHLQFPTDSSHSQGYVADMPVLGVLTAFICSSLGLDPVPSSQLVIAILGAVTVSIVFLLSLQLWPNRRTALVSATVLALVGSFAFSTGCVWKESLGFLLLATMLLAYPKRSQLRYRVLMTLPLPLLVFTHHHTTVVSFVILTFAVALDLARALRRHEPSRVQYMDIATVMSCWGLAAAYYARISLPYLDYLSPGTDLYLYIAVAALLTLVAVSLSSRERPVTRLPIELVIPVVGLAILAVNYYHPLFSGIPSPGVMLVVPAAAYLLLTVPAWTGSTLALSRQGQGKDLMLAMLLGPLSLILFGFVRGTDPTSHLIIYRTFDFLMPAFAVLVGLGFAYMVKGHVRLGMAAAASLVVILASTLPIAYGSQELFGVENQTYWYEYDAVEWFSENGVDSYTSDQRLGETGWRLFDIDYGRGLPYDLREGIALNASSFYVVEGSWTTTGAQEFPFGTVVLSEETLESFKAEGSVLYVGGSAGDQLLLVMTGT